MKSTSIIAPLSIRRETAWSGDRGAYGPRRFTLLAAAAMTMMAGAASAQDVVVMRRPIATPNRTGAPHSPSTPTPTVTPAPIPTPTPAPPPPAVAGEWVPGAWVDQQSGACNASMPQTRAVVCQVAGDTVDAARCTTARPSTAQTAQSVSGCTYRAGAFTATPRAPSCSTEATLTETAPCLRSDGTAVSEASCTGRGVEVTRITTSPDYSACSTRWSYSAYADPGASCTTREIQTRTATCVRELDGERLAEDRCDPAKREALTLEAADQSGCRPYWQPASGWGEWSSQCATTATRTREIGCFQRETGCVEGSPGYWAGIDGERDECIRKIDADRCVNADTTEYSPTNGGSETAAVYASCSHTWNPGDYDTAPDCTRARTWTRAVTCERDLDRTSADPAMCDAATRPATEKQAPDYRSCQSARTWSTTDPAIFHVGGHAGDGGWIGDRGAGATHIVFGPYYPYVSPGDRVAMFTMRIAGDGGGPDDGVVSIDIFDATAGGPIGQRTVLIRDFANAGVDRTFEIPFTITPDMVNHHLEFRTFHFGVVTTTVKSVGYR